MATRRSLSLFFLRAKTMPDICIDRIIVFSWQSNMQGQTEGDPHGNEFSGGYEYLLLQDEIIPLKNPVGGGDIGELLASSFEGGGSLVTYFVRTVTEKRAKTCLPFIVRKVLRKYRNG